MTPLSLQVRKGSRKQFLQTFGTGVVRVQGLWGGGATAAPCQGRLAHGGEELEGSPKDSYWGVFLLQVALPFGTDLERSWERSGCKVRRPGGGSSTRRPLLSPVRPLPCSALFAAHSACPHPSVPVSLDSREFTPSGLSRAVPLACLVCRATGSSRTSLSSPSREVRFRGRTRCRMPVVFASSTSPRFRPAWAQTGPSRAVNPLVAAPGCTPHRGHAPTRRPSWEVGPFLACIALGSLEVCSPLCVSLSRLGNQLLNP